MDQPEPVTDWPDRPLTETEAADLVDETVRAVYVMDHSSAVQEGVGADEDEVIEIVLETDSAYRMYSYAASSAEDDATWRDYGRESKAGEAGTTMRQTLASYRVLAGDPEHGT
jgi:hypothetical protein